MSLEKFFEWDEERARSYILEKINYTKENLSKGILEKSMEIRKLYEGVDFYAVNLLGQAIERGKFDEIVDELNSYYNDFLSKITPNLRRIPSETTAKIAEFFSKCHKELEMGC